MQEQIIMFGILGLTRGLNGIKKHIKDKDFVAKPKKLLLSLGLAAGIGVSAELALNYAGFPVSLGSLEGIISGIFAIAAPWFGTDIIEDIFKI